VEVVTLGTDGFTAAVNPLAFFQGIGRPRARLWVD